MSAAVCLALREKKKHTQRKLLVNFRITNIKYFKSSKDKDKQTTHKGSKIPQMVTLGVTVFYGNPGNYKSV
jgi:hypothetical protein